MENSEKRGARAFVEKWGPYIVAAAMIVYVAMLARLVWLDVAATSEIPGIQ